MQVSEQKDHITHAVLGGGETIDFGISTSAEFFNILSSTLYKDQILAVVREVLCNAWDAHIEAGCTNKAVEITLTKDKFVIRDFGKGIHRDDIGLIYGTYGNSTKKNDGKQTGGFGLGCKAPFAYTDHFEVQSNHDHVRTIYNLSKSSAQAQGKPGIVPIASFPTMETGLQVTIPILSQEDYRRFYQLVRRIVRNGDMNMTLNGAELRKLDFDTATTSVLITLDDDIIENQPSIMVRYGNVIYPVDSTTELAHNYNRIVNHLEKLGNERYYNSNQYYIIFQAPPHSIAVTPSRESLSMQGHTTKTLNTLFEDFLSMLDKDFPIVCNGIATAVVDEAIKLERIGKLLSTEAVLPIVHKGVFTMPPRITDLESMARRYMEANYPDDIAFRKKDITYRLTEMVKAKLLDRGLVQTYLRALVGVNVSIGTSQFHRDNTIWLQQHVVGRVAGRLLKAGMPVNNLYVYDPQDRNSPRKGYGREIVPITPARQASPKHLIKALPYLRNIVVLATSTNNLMDRCKKHEVFQKMGDDYGFLFYHVGLKKKDKEDAIAFFKATNMNVVDLTFKQEWEIEKFNGVPITPVPRKKAKKGVACLTSLVSGKNAIHLSNFMEDDADRIEAPEFMVEVSLRNDVSKSTFSYPWSGTASRAIVDLFGSKGGITNKSDVMAKWLAGGAKRMDDYVTEKVCQYMMTSPTIQEYWAFKRDRLSEIHEVGHTSLLSSIYANPTLRAEYGLVNNLTDEDKQYMLLWDELVRNCRNGLTKDLIPASEHLKKIPLHQVNFDLVKKFQGNKLLRVINDSGLTILINSTDKTAADEAISLLNLILNK